MILLAGCRLLSGDVLAQIQCLVLNYHAGITPNYRGMNGGYWALATGDRQNFGATVHFVDAGVDILDSERSRSSGGVIIDIAPSARPPTARTAAGTVQSRLLHLPS